MSTDSTPTLDTMLLLDALPFSNLDAADFSLLDNQPPLPTTGSLFADLGLAPPPLPLLFDDLDLGPPVMFPLPPLDIADASGELLLNNGLDMPAMDIPHLPALGGGDSTGWGAGSVAAGPSNAVVVPTDHAAPGPSMPRSDHAMTTAIPSAWPPASHTTAGFALPGAAFPAGSQYTPAMGGPSVPFRAPANLGVQYFAPIGHADANAAGPSRWATHLHGDGAHFNYGMYNPAFGLYAQEYNTFSPPGQSQSGLSANDEPASSSASASTDAQPSRKRGRPSNAAAAAADGKRTAKRQKVTAPINDLTAEPPRVRFEDTPAGRLCTERGYTRGMAMPVTCFLCDEDDSVEHTEYFTFASFARHMTSCEVKDEPERWPKCHYCKEPIRAYKRPDQMARHHVGGDGNVACKPLQDLRRSGVNTYGAMADWLIERGLPIRNEFLGQNLAKALRLAVQENPVGRDQELDLPLPKEKGKKGKKTRCLRRNVK